MFGLIPVSALGFPSSDSRLPLGSWAWPIRLSLRQAWDWERERLSQLAEGCGPWKSHQFESWACYFGETLWAVHMDSDKENSLLGQLTHLCILKPVHALAWGYHCSWENLLCNTSQALSPSYTPHKNITAPFPMLTINGFNSPGYYQVDVCISHSFIVPQISNHSSL